MVMTNVKKSSCTRSMKSSASVKVWLILVS